jgi:hypothetical protein
MSARDDVLKMITENLDLPPEQAKDIGDDHEIRELAGGEEERGANPKLNKFFDALAAKKGKLLDDHGRFMIDTVAEAIEWLMEDAEAGDDDGDGSAGENAIGDGTNQFLWREKLSGGQKKLLGALPIIGAIIFFVGVQFQVRGVPGPGEWIAAVGMILAVQMFWGMGKVFVYLEKKNSPMLQRLGYQKLFWAVMWIALFIDVAVAVTGTLIDPFQ